MIAATMYFNVMYVKWMNGKINTETFVPLQLFVKNETLEDLNIKAQMVTTNVMLFSVLLKMFTFYIYVPIMYKTVAPAFTVHNSMFNINKFLRSVNTTIIFKKSKGYMFRLKAISHHQA
jgi:hypothetical protein